MEIVQLTLGALGTNCYLVKREEGVLVIDPAAEPERIASKLASLGWKPDAVVLTTEEGAMFWCNGKRSAGRHNRAGRSGCAAADRPDVQSFRALEQPVCLQKSAATAAGWSDLYGL